MTSSFKLNTKSTPIIKKSQLTKTSESQKPLKFIFTPYADSPKLPESSPEYSSPMNSNFSPPPSNNCSPNYDYNYYSNNIEPFYPYVNYGSPSYSQQFYPTSYPDPFYQPRYPMHYNAY